MPESVGVVPVLVAVSGLDAVLLEENKEITDAPTLICPVITPPELDTPHAERKHSPTSPALLDAGKGRPVMVTLPDGEPVQPDSAMLNRTVI